MQKFKYDIAAMDFNNAGYISSKIKKMLVSDGIDNQVIRRVSIASYEAEINVVIHSFGGYAEIYYDEDSLKMEFHDYGPGIESIEDAMKEGFSTASELDRENGFGAGMGFPNMLKTADKLEVETSNEGTIITIYFDLRGARNANK